MYGKSIEFIRVNLLPKERYCDLHLVSFLSHFSKIGFQMSKDVDFAPKGLGIFFPSPTIQGFRGKFSSSSFLIFLFDLLFSFLIFPPLLLSFALYYFPFSFFNLFLYFYSPPFSIFFLFSFSLGILEEE